MLFLFAFVIASLILLRVLLRRSRRSLKRTVLTFAVLVFLIVATMFGGPLSSGALFLLLPAPARATAYEFPRGYQPLHKGHVDLPTGLYVREDEDLVLSESPWFVWRRAYLSNDRIARRMGIGTTHNAEWYLSGDPKTVQKISLIIEDGRQIVFNRTSRGSSFVNAMFIHTHSDTEFYGARLGWTGRKWALRFTSGALAIFQSCGPAPGESCSLLSLRGPDGVVQFMRDERRVLRAIDAGTQRITFEYDDQRRVIRASDGRHTASYSYDREGRLVRAVVDGITRSYSYGSRDEMLLIEEPGRSIENAYDGDLRLARQVVRYPGRPDYVQLFAYVVEGDKVRETTMTENDGSRTVYRWNDAGRSELEVHESEGHSPVIVQFARAADGFTRSITVFCSNDGRRVSGTADIDDGDEDGAEAELVRRLCN